MRPTRAILIWRSTLRACAILGLLLGVVGRSAHAAPLADPTLPEFRNVSLGAILDFGYGSSSVGQSLLGQLGAEYVGIQSFRGRSLLVQWDTLLAARGGILGNTLPFTSLAGAHTLASVSAGYRWHRARYSLYTGGRLDGDLSVLAHPGTSLGDLRSLNDLDGVGGVSAHGAIRAEVGLSLLDGRRSLLVVAFFQEAARAPAVYTPGTAFAEGGIAARFDLSGRLTASIAAFAGRSPTTTQAVLDTTDQSTYAAFEGVVRAILPDGIWLSLSGGYGRQLDHRVYRASATSYDTASAPTFSATLLLGVPFDVRKKRSPAP